MSEQLIGKPATRAKNKYSSANYDSLRIVVPKGRKQAIEAHAEKIGESINGLVNRLIRENMGLSDEEWKTREE